MRFGLDVPTTGEYADPRTLAQLATEAEVMGWDGFFIWDVLLGGANPPLPSVDPWIALTAIALRTTRIRLGCFVLPLARHRPWLVARQLANLDHLSSGRVTCAVGLGHQPRDFAAFAEPDAPATRARLLDEGLAVLTGLWETDHFSFRGEHYTLDDVALAARPVQTPRIPIWVAGRWPRPKSMRRVLRHDGWIPDGDMAPADIRAGKAWIEEHRTQAGPFDIVSEGETPGDDPAKAREIIGPYAEAGISWWLESRWGQPVRVEEARARIRQGPPLG